MKRLQNLLSTLGAAALLAIGLPAAADQLPAALQAQGTPEVTLARITLGKTTLKDVIETYGPPTQEQRTPKNPFWVGYTWNLGGGVLKIDVNLFGQCPVIGNIYVQGTGEGRLGVTGAGLRLGDDIDALNRIYGDKYKVFDVSHLHALGWQTGTPGDRQVFLQWAAGGGMLIGLDRAGRIDAMRLDAAQSDRSPCAAPIRSKVQPSP